MTEEKAEWDLKDLLLGRTIEDLERDIKDKTERFKSWREQLSNNLSPEQLKSIIMLKEDVLITAEAISDYYGLQFTVNTKDQESLGKMTYYGQLFTDISNQLLFFNLWWMHLDDSAAARLIAAEEVRDYRYYLERIRKAKPYTKDEETEKILNIKDITTSGFSQLYDILTSSFAYSFDGKEGLTQDELKRYVYNRDPKKREEAYRKLLSPYKEHKTLLTEIYKNVVLDWDNEGMRIRGYKDPLAVRNTGNDIDEKAVTAMLNVIKRHNDLFISYFELRRRANELHGQPYEHSRHHIYAPFAGSPEKRYSYTAAKDIVLDTYQKFDERFYRAAKGIFDAGHVHSHPRPNKRSGAFCSYLGGIVKPYILLNHDGTVRDVFTMMHEFGHGIHGVFAEKQRPLLHQAGIPMAETASIMGEMILADRLLRESRDEKEKIAILMHLLDNEWASITRQAYFALFEQEAHEKIRAGATADDLDELYHKLLREQFGDMSIPEEFKEEWNYIPHIHHTPFYVYGYAWGNLLVLSLYGKYKEEGKAFIEQYVQLLEKGGSERPQEALAAIGMDVTRESFWEAGFSVIKEQLSSLRELTR